MKRERHLRVVPDDPTQDHETTIAYLHTVRDRVPVAVVTDLDNSVGVRYRWDSAEAGDLFECMKTVREREKGSMTLNEMQQAMGMSGVVNAFLDWEVERGSAK